MRLRYSGLVLAGALLVSGCHILGQDNLPPALGGLPPAPPPKPAPPPPKPAGPPALLTIHPGPGVYWREPLRQAVDEARRRKADVAFDVVTVVPLTGDVAAQMAAAQADGSTAADVGRSIASLGVAANRIALSARTDPGVTESEVRIYVH